MRNQVWLLIRHSPPCFFCLTWAAGKTGGLFLDHIQTCFLPDITGDRGSGTTRREGSSGPRLMYIIMESVFSLAARRACVAVGTSLPARAGELEHNPSNVSRDHRPLFVASSASVSGPMPFDRIPL